MGKVVPSASFVVDRGQFDEDQDGEVCNWSQRLSLYLDLYVMEKSWKKEKYHTQFIIHVLHAMS